MSNRIWKGKIDFLHLDPCEMREHHVVCCAVSHLQYIKPIRPIGHKVYWIESDFDVVGDCSICLWIGWTESGTASPLVWNRLVVSMYLDTNW